MKNNGHNGHAELWGTPVFTGNRLDDRPLIVIL